MRTRHSEWLKGVPAPAQGPAAAHEQPPPRTPGTVSGKRPTEALLQREREYVEHPHSTPYSHGMPATLTRARETEGQCEGTTRLGNRCKVHRTSKYAVAESLRRGERFCGHHHPDKCALPVCTA